MLNDLTNKFPQYHVTRDYVPAPLQRLELEKITGYQSVRFVEVDGIAMICESYWRQVFRPSFAHLRRGKRTSSPARAIFFLSVAPALRTTTAKRKACTANCEWAMHNGNLLGPTTSVYWYSATTRYSSTMLLGGANL